jgi:hypothetical protein
MKCHVWVSAMVACIPSVSILSADAVSIWEKDGWAIDYLPSQVTLHAYNFEGILHMGQYGALAE